MSSPSAALKGKASVLCAAATAFKKKPGQLSLTKTHLVWNLQGSDKTEGELTFDNSRLNSLFMSKEGGAKVVLKVGVLDITGGTNEESYNFTFTSAASAVSDREHFKREISQIIAKNKAAAASAANASASSAPSTAPPTPGPSGIAATINGQFNGLPSPAEAAAAASKVLAAAAANGTRSDTPVASASNGTIMDPTKDWAVRQRLLKKNADLRQLHIDLVRTGQISEEEFWEGREQLLVAEAIQHSQIRGRNAQLVDPKPEQGDNGEVKIKLSQQLIKDIFEQYPIVAKVYNDNVPEPLSEGEFWHRYFHSRLFDRHRASGGSSLSGGASSSNIKDDPIFDRYLEDEDDDLEPKNAALQDQNVYSLLNLAATEEDHQESGNIKDFTMRAGGQKRSLPLMRRFNEHSERLLEQTMGHDPLNKKTGRIDGGDAGSRRYYEDIVIDDLQGEEAEELVPLDVRERETLFEGMSANEADSATKKRKRLTEEEEEKIFTSTKARNSEWTADLARFSFPSSEAKLALQSLQTNISSRLSNSVTSSIANSKMFPEQVLRSMISCQASANEFLRHFWSAVLPAQTGDISASAMANPQQRAAKATRMIEYLQKTQERVDTVVKEAEKIGADPTAVREALQPCIQAVKKATKYFRDKANK